MRQSRTGLFVVADSGCILRFKLLTFSGVAATPAKHAWQNKSAVLAEQVPAATSRAVQQKCRRHMAHLQNWSISLHVMLRTDGSCNLRMQRIQPISWNCS
jgi:predicted phosphoadenosine phosphosulfate sulfurtransferase